MRNPLRTILPALLAVANALFWYWPTKNLIMGWGDDPYFNLWVYEHNWDQFAAHGPLAFLTRAFWDSNIFYPQKLTIALSENYAYSSLLAWPLRVLTGSGFQAMSLLAIAGNLGAFVFTALWLRSLGLRRFAWWGGLLFSACGWIQSQSAHYQNTAIFVFPLALWMWNRFIEKPNALRIAACAASFAVAVGFNLYFQTFLNVILIALVAYAAVRNRGFRWKALIVLGTAALLEVPIAYRYIQLQHVIGDYSVGLDEYRAYAAHWASLFFHKEHKNLIQAFWPSFYPSMDSTIEAAGFIGYTWLALWITSFFNGRVARFWALLAAAAFLVALGPDYGVLHLLRPIPGMSSLRSIGRAQVLSMLFSIPAVLLMLESRATSRRDIAALCLVLLELAPGQMRHFKHTDEFTFATKELTDTIVAQKSPSLLMVPGTPTIFQLTIVHVPVRLYGGYSGRMPLGSGLVNQVAGRWNTLDDFDRTLRFTQAGLVGTVDDNWAEKLRHAPQVASVGCSMIAAMHLCLFRVTDETRQRIAQSPLLRLDRDASWEYSYDHGHHIGRLGATREGMLDLMSLANCRLQEHLKFPFLPDISGGKKLEDWYFRDVSFGPRGLVMERVSAQAIFRLPDSIRPQKTYEIVCDDNSNRPE